MRSPLANVCVGAVVTVAGTLLGQRVLYGDSMTFLRAMETGRPLRHGHALGLVPIEVVRAGGMALGFGAYEASRFASALGNGVAAALVVPLATLAGLSRRRAVAAALLAGTAPSALFFASVVELHAPFAPFAVLAMLAAVAATRAPSLFWAIGAGACFGLAQLVHSSALLLPLAVAPLVVGSVRWRHVAAVIAGFAISQFARPWLIAGLGGSAAAGEPPAYLQANAAHALAHPDLLAAALWHEWLLPFAPVSIAWLVGTRERRIRKILAIAIAGYLVATWLALGPWRERGAYLFPLVVPAAIVVARHTAWQWLVAIGVAGLAFAVPFVRTHDDPDRANAYGRGVATIAAGRDVFLLAGDFADVEAVFVARPDLLHRHVLVTEPPYVDASTMTAAVDDLVAHVRRVTDGGGVVLLSDGVPLWLARDDIDERFPTAGALWRLLQLRLVLRPVAADGFRGAEVTVRE